MNAQDKAESLRLIKEIERDKDAMTDDGSGHFIFCIDALRNIIELQDGDTMAAWGAAQERERWLRSVGPAYGYLWCVNNEPGTPNQYPPERAAYEARRLLRDLLTKVERGEFINTVVQILRQTQQGD